MYLISKFFQAVLTVFLVSVIVFLLFQIVPGDPILNRLGDAADPMLEQVLREQFGLDRPPLERYLTWVQNLFQGDMGVSIRFNLPVSELLMARLPTSMALLTLSMVLTVVLGVPLGFAAARFTKDARGLIFNILTQIGTSIPSFFMAIILILIFAIGLQWFAVISYVPIERGLLPYLRGLFLPALGIAMSSMTTLARFVRSSVLEELSMDYVRTAKNKGVSMGTILWRHVLRNSLIPVLTMLGILIATNIGGAIVIESAFSIPGIGSLLHVGLLQRDLPLVQGLSLYIATVVVVIFFLIDVLYHIIDPRIGTPGKED